MGWMDEVGARLKRKNQILFAKDSECLQDLALLIQEQNHRILVLWALDFAAESVTELREKYPDEKRPQEALAAAWDWAAGKIKMPLARQKILACHAFAKEIDCKEDIAMCHAIGQACAVVHTVGHALGYPIYDLTAIVRRYGMEHCFEAVEMRRREYLDRLLYWREHWSEYEGADEFRNFRI